MRTKIPFSVKYLLEGLDDQTREKFLSMCRCRTFAKGEILIDQGDHCSGLLMISSGEVVRQKYTTGGDCSILDILETGDVVGIEYFPQNVDHYRYEVEAISSGSLYSLSNENLQSFASQYPQINANLQKLMAEQVARQDIHIDILSQKSVRKKIATYILAHTQSDETAKTCRLPASRETFARYLALPRQSLARELRALTDAKIIFVHARNVTVLDRASLIRMIDET